MPEPRPRTRASLAETLRFTCVVVVVGAAAGVFAVVLRLALHAAYAGALHAPDVLTAFFALPRWARLTLPSAGGLVAGVIGVLAARDAGGHGFAAILEAVTLGRGRIALATTLWKAAGSFVAIASGGSIGREGPILQFGAATADTLGHRLGLPEKRTRVLVAAGTAAGFAAAYNTPIAAVLFVIEVVTGIVSIEVVLPVIVATTVSTALSRVAVGAEPIYGQRTFEVVSHFEFFAFVALGVLAGLLGPAFLWLLSAGGSLFKRLALARPLAGALGGLGVGVLATVLPEVAGNGYEAIQLVLDGKLGPTLLAALLVAKALATTSSVGSGSPGGIFTPTLFLGASLGGLVGHGLDAFAAPWSHGAAGGYALVGMAAMTAATTHAPLMAAALAFELSGDYAVVLPLFVATAAATFVARRVRRESVYAEELRRAGVALEGSLAERLARAVRARDLLDRDPAQLPASASVDDALSIFERTRARVVYVVGAGPVRAFDLHAAKALWLARLRDPRAPVPANLGEASSPVPNARADDTLPALSERLWGVDWGEIPVVSDDEPARLLGFVTRRSLLGAFDRELLGRDILYTRVVRFEQGDDAPEYLELPPGQGVEVINAPPRFVGHTLDVAALRREHHLVLLAVRKNRPTGATPHWRDPGERPRVEPGERWMVVADRDSVERLTGHP